MGRFRGGGGPLFQLYGSIAGRSRVPTRSEFNWRSWREIGAGRENIGFKSFHAFQLLFDDRSAGSGRLRSRLCALSVDAVCSLIPSLQAKRPHCRRPACRLC